MLSPTRTTRSPVAASIGNARSPTSGSTPIAARIVPADPLSTARFPVREAGDVDWWFAPTLDRAATAERARRAEGRDARCQNAIGLCAQAPAQGVPRCTVLKVRKADAGALPRCRELSPVRPRVSADVPKVVFVQQAATKKMERIKKDESALGKTFFMCDVPARSFLTAQW